MKMVPLRLCSVAETSHLSSISRTCNPALSFSKSGSLMLRFHGTVAGSSMVHVRDPMCVRDLSEVL